MTKTKQNFQHLNQKLLGIQKHIRTLRILLVTKTNITKLRKRIKQSSQQILSEIRSLEIWNPSQKVRVIRSQWQRNMKNCIQRISPRLCQQWIWNQWKTRIQRIERKSCLSARCSINEKWRCQGFLGKNLIHVWRWQEFPYLYIALYFNVFVISIKYKILWLMILLK